MDVSQVIEIIQQLIVIVALVLIYKSFPAAKVDGLLDRLGTDAAKTETKTDDEAVKLAAAIVALLKPMLDQTRQEVPPTPAGEPTSKHWED